MDFSMNNIKSPHIKTSSFYSAFDFFSFLLFLFFIQQITFLVESVYMMNLLHTKADSRVFGIFFLAMPALLFFVKPVKFNYILLVALMLFCILLSPVLPTPIRIFSSGFGAGLFLLYFALQFSDSNLPEANWGQVAALATLTSAAFRAMGHSYDISVSGNTKFVGWILVFLAVSLFYKIIKEYPFQNKIKSVEIKTGNNNRIWLGVFGLVGSIMLIYFAFSSPAVIARWTEGNYTGIYIVLCGSILIYMLLGLRILQFSKLRKLLLVWNAVFFMQLILNFLLNRVQFPSTPESAPVIVAETHYFNQIITYLMLLSSPVIFINITFFSLDLKAIQRDKLATPFLTGAIIMAISIFMLIFSNVWGYVRPFSNVFRNQFHLPFAIAALLMSFPFLFIKYRKQDLNLRIHSPASNAILSIVIVILGIGAVWQGNVKQVGDKTRNIYQLTLMTYNIQQGVDLFGNKNNEGQLAFIAGINPDILCVQESDICRISGGNSDIVRYFAEKLGFFSYYGPKTVTGTFGTAILSRFPLDSCRTIFTYSNVDEIGTAVAKISVDNQDILIINSHPAGNVKARESHINVVAKLAEENEMVVAAGDYNFRQESPYYKLIASKLNNAWQTKYPSGIGTVDMNKLDESFKDRNRSSGILIPGGKIEMTDRIDHIFLSKDFKVLEAYYLPAPESGTDHPVHWAVVSW